MYIYQGDAKEAYEIIQQINCWNNGKSAKLSFDAFSEDPDSTTSRQNDGKSKGLLATIWMQTVPLLKPPYLGSTVLICIIVMLISSTTTG